jgi:hypothetical protein
MTKFRKRPVVIEAVQWTGENVDEVLAFGNTGPMPLWGDDFKIDRERGEAYILSLEGTHTASKGDWIIQGVKGEFYACKPDIFELTYESAQEDE